MAEIIEEDKLWEEFETNVASVRDIERSLLPGNESEHEGDFTQYSESPYDYDDLFNFDASVAIPKVEKNEMTSEFLYALSEIDGEMSFPCTLCDSANQKAVFQDTQTQNTPRLPQDVMRLYFVKKMPILLFKLSRIKL